MIKNIFIPEQFNGYFILSKRIIGLSFSKSFIQATKILVSQRSITVEKLHTQPIENNNDKTYEERVELALQATIKEMGSYDELRTSLPSSQVIFKELTLPFTDPEKIAQVINFEIESFLPFPSQEGVIDFIITKIDPATQHATVMVAAVRKQTLLNHLALFKSLNIDVDAVTVDVLDLYGLYQQAHAQSPERTVILDGNYEQTRLLLIDKGQLLSVRSIPYGISSIAKTLSISRSIDIKQAMEELLRFGIEKNNDTAYTQTTQQALQSYWSSISFTIQSWITQNFPGEKLDSITLIGPLIEIVGIPDYIQNLSTIPCTLFTTQSLIQSKLLKTFNNQPTPIHYIQSLATAYPSAVTYQFNLLKNEFAPSRIGLVNKQLFAGLMLAIFILATLFISGSMYIKKLNKAIMNSQQEVLNYLEDSGLASNTETLEDAINDAESRVNEGEAIWFSFSSQTRFSFLKNLEQLSSAIDREGIGLQLKNLAITSNSITLDGSVRDFTALKALERELKKSGLFTNVPTLQNTSFSNLKLILKRQNGANRS